MARVDVPVPLSIGDLGGPALAPSPWSYSGPPNDVPLWSLGGPPTRSFNDAEGTVLENFDNFFKYVSGKNAIKVLIHDKNVSALSFEHIFCQINDFW